MRAYTVPAPVSPIRREVVIRESPRPKRDERANAGSVFRERIPVFPGVISAKRIPVKIRKRSVPVTKADWRMVSKNPSGDRV
jgi:hypothetical protein